MKNQNKFTARKENLGFLWVCSAVLLFFFSPMLFAQSTGSVKHHPVPAEFTSEKRFKVLVNKIPVQVFHAGLHVYFVSFDFTGVADIKIEAKEIDYWKSKAEVRPASAHIDPVTHDNTVSFFIHKAGQYSVEKPGIGAFNDEVILVFANPPEVELTKKTTKGLIYLEPGIHQRNINLQSGETLYLAAGAVLFGSINIWNANNVRIMGRGIVMHYGPQSEDEDFGWINKKNWHCLTTNTVKGLIVSGVTFIGRSRTWTIQLHTTFDAIFDNIKILAVNPQNINGDGIDWYGGGRAKVMNSFIKSMDDCFAFFTPASSLDMWSDTKLTEGQVTDIHIENCVLWTTLANIYRIGFKGQALVTDKFTMKNCDIIHFNKLTWQAPASLVCVVSPNKKGMARHSNYLFQNIRFEDAVAILGLQNPEAQLTNFTFRDIVMNVKPIPSLINCKISNFKFENVVLGKKLITKESELIER